MAARVVLSSEDALNGVENSCISNKPQYWEAKNHSSSSYLRAENWLPDIEDLLLPGRHEIVKISLEQGKAILRYREELKMYAAIKDEKTPNIDSMQSPLFLDNHWVLASKEWPNGQNRAEWWKELNKLESDIDNIVQKFNRKAFIKLSVRSPKDSAFCLTKTEQIIKERVRESVESNCSVEYELSENVSALKYGAWQALRVENGKEALQLLLRSDRIYLDILQHELFLQSQKNPISDESSGPAQFNLNVIVSEFFEGFHPDFEFRGFVSKGIRTGLTVYNPWVYHKSLIENKQKILSLISELWTKVEERIANKVLDYSLDFAVAPTCEAGQCWIIEINAFLPPLAGSGLYSMHNPDDAKLIESGPFEFRIRDIPVTINDFTLVKIDQNTGRKTTIQMEPAPKQWMEFVYELRKRLKGGQDIKHLTVENWANNNLITKPNNNNTKSCIIC